MPAHKEGDEILKFVAILGVGGSTTRTAASVEGSQYGNAGVEVLGGLGGAVVEILEAKLVQRLGAEHLRVA